MVSLRGRIVISRLRLRTLRWRYRSLLDRELQSYLPLSPPRGTEKLERADRFGNHRPLRVNQSNQRKPNRSDERFRRMGMENLDVEDRFVDGSGERESDPLVPHRFGGIVGACGDAVIRVEVENDVGFQVSVAPVDVLQVLR